MFNIHRFSLFSALYKSIYKIKNILSMHTLWAINQEPICAIVHSPTITYDLLILPLKANLFINRFSTDCVVYCTDKALRVKEKSIAKPIQPPF